MDIILIPTLQLVSFLFTLYTYAVVTYIIVTLLLNFQVINPSSSVVRSLVEFLYKIVEPVLAKIRTVVPLFGPVDLSPLVLLLGIYFIQNIIVRIILHLA